MLLAIPMYICMYVAMYFHCFHYLLSMLLLEKCMCVRTVSMYIYIFVDDTQMSQRKVLLFSAVVIAVVSIFLHKCKLLRVVL